MSRAASLAHRIERTVSGPMWHGPALTVSWRQIALLKKA